MWYSCSIATNAWFEMPEWGDSLCLSHGISFKRIPEWVKHDEALKLLSWNDRKNIQDAEWALVFEYEADALGSPDPKWQGPNPRGIQDTVAERFSLMDLCLWLVNPSNLGFGATLHFGRVGDPASMRQFVSTKPVLIRDDELDNQLTSQDWEAASMLLRSILSLERDKTCWIAIWFLIRAVTEELWQGRYLWQWIVLEALFGPDSPNETTHRLAQRIALFADAEPIERKAIFKSIKDAYSWRSKLVHGGRTNSLTAEKSQELTVLVESSIRRAITKILNSDELIKVFNGKTRDAYLEDLVFSN